MKKVSKLFAFLLAGVMTLSLASCGSDDSSSSAASKASQAAGSSASAASDSENPEVARIQKAGVLKVSTEAGFEPFEYVDGDKVVGIDMDIAQYMADKWGVELEVKDMNFDTALAEVATGNSDMALAGVSKTEERDQNMDFSDPYFSSNQVIVVKADNNDITGKADLEDKTIGVQSGSSGDFLAVESVGDTVKIMRYVKYAVALLDMKNGQIDCVIMDSYPAQKALAQNEGEIKILDEAMGADEYCVAVSEGNADLQKAVNEVLKEMKDSGKLEEIFNNYKSSLEGDE